MSIPDWLVVSVTLHYLVIGILYARAQGSLLFLGLYFCYAAANVFLILIAMQAARIGRG
jgi:hypothetical protein